MTTLDSCAPVTDDTPLPTSLRDAVCVQLGIAPAPPTLDSFAPNIAKSSFASQTSTM